MRRVLYLAIVSLLFSCSNEDRTTFVAVDTTQSTVQPATLEIVQDEAKEFCWIGKLNGSIPVCLYYETEGELLIGQITYLNTKNKMPIKLVGTRDPINKYRLLEFDATGNITGIITGKPNGELFTGSWFSPKTRKELSFTASKKDTIISLENSQTEVAHVFGTYHYQYGTEGSQGDLSIQKLNDTDASFSIFSVTSAPARNMADVPEDTIELNQTSFIYTIPESDNCGFKVALYKDFAYVTYTNGYFDGQFGHNASVDGIYLKVK